MVRKWYSTMLLYCGKDSSNINNTRPHISDRDTHIKYTILQRIVVVTRNQKNWYRLTKVLSVKKNPKKQSNLYNERSIYQRSHLLRVYNIRYILCLDNYK